MSCPQKSILYQKIYFSLFSNFIYKMWVMFCMSFWKLYKNYLTNRKSGKRLVYMSHNDPRYGDDSYAIQWGYGTLGCCSVHYGLQILLDSKTHEESHHRVNNCEIKESVIDNYIGYVLIFFISARFCLQQLIYFHFLRVFVHYKYQIM